MVTRDKETQWLGMYRQSEKEQETICMCALKAHMHMLLQRMHPLRLLWWLGMQM